MALTRQDLRTKPLTKYDLSSSLEGIGPCRLMAASVSGPALAWEGIALTDGAEVGPTPDIIFKVLTGQSQSWSFAPGGIRFANLSAGIWAPGAGSAFTYIFIIRE